MGFDHDTAIRAYTSRLDHNTGQIERLTQLCDAIIKRMTESTKAQEVDELRGELAVHRNEINVHERENREIMVELRALREKRSGGV